MIEYTSDNSAGTHKAHCTVCTLNRKLTCQIPMKQHSDWEKFSVHVLFSLCILSNHFYVAVEIMVSYKR